MKVGRSFELCFAALSLTAALWHLPARAAAIRLNFYPEPGSERSWDLEKKAAELFARENPGYILRLHEQSNLEDHLRAVQKDYEASGAKDLLFAPLGSLASDQFELRGTQSDRDYFLMQVTASHEFLTRHKAIAVFFEDKNYLQNLVPSLLAVSRKRPGKVHIVRNQWIPYLQKVEDAFRAELARFHLPMAKTMVAPRAALAPRVKDLLKNGKIQPDDWILFLDLGPSKFAALENEEALGPVQKIFIYGPATIEGRGPLFRNSTHMLFWHPQVKYPGSGRWSNCDFVREFQKSAGSEAEFHVAYLFAALEAGAALKGAGVPFAKISGAEAHTILGKIQWAPDGRRRNTSPLYNHLDNAMNSTLLTADPNLETCTPGTPNIRYIKN